MVLLLDIGAEVGCEGLAWGGSVTLLPIVSVRRSDRSLRGGLSVRGEGRKSALPDRRVQGADERIAEVTRTSRLR